MDLMLFALLQVSKKTGSITEETIFIVGGGWLAIASVQALRGRWKETLLTSRVLHIGADCNVCQVSNTARRPHGSHFVR